MIKFGPSGNSLSFFEEGFSKTEQAALWVRERGLDLFEYSFGRGITMGEAKAEQIGNAFANEGIEISVHAPYYINLSNPDEEMIEKSFAYILDSAKMLLHMGGKRVVFHPATQGKMSRETAFNLALERMKRLCERIYEEGLDGVMFCPETMGKLAQIGTVEEIAELCAVDKVFTPCVDFGHVNAREQGSLKAEDDYLKLLNYLIERLGIERVRNMHVHFSKIQYTAKGELRHLTFADDKYGPEFEPLAGALIKLSLEPYIVSESDGTQAEDAAEMKKIYNRLLKSPL